MSNIPLRKSGPFVFPETWDSTKNDYPPKALRSLSQIIDNNLCHRCGSCVGICPMKVLGLDEDLYPTVQNLSACTDCNLCTRVCPGEEFNANYFSKKIFDSDFDPRTLHGNFSQACLGYATNQKTRENTSSGGVVTALLLSLLEKGIIDGAIVIASHPEDKWRGVPIIARTKEEILASAKSKYMVVPTNVTFEEIRKVEGKYALVGLPCQIHGYHKAAQINKKIAERIVLTIGLFCHAAMELEPLRFVWDSLGEKKKDVEKVISRVGKHPGEPQFVFKDGSVRPLYFPKAKGYRPNSTEMLNALFLLYTPQRCMTCFDATAEFADISVGDPWMVRPFKDTNFKEGFSFTLVRTKRGEALLNEAVSAGDLNLMPIENRVAKTSNTIMAYEKHLRAYFLLHCYQDQGKLFPLYGFSAPKASLSQKIKMQISMWAHTFCFYPTKRKAFLRLLLSPVGYLMLWLNFQRRKLKKRNHS